MTEKVTVKVFVTCEIEVYVGLYDSKTSFYDILQQSKNRRY